MKLDFLDKIQLKRVERKIAKKKLKLSKKPVDLEEGELHSVRLRAFSSYYWFSDNVQKTLERKGYKVVRLHLAHKVVISWK